MQKLTNHIALVVDRSASMTNLAHKVVDVFDREVQHLRQRSIELDQETRVSIYVFDSEVKNICWDIDVMRAKSLMGLYSIGGSTALMDATALAINDLKKIPELYTDHAFLVYILTDGEENRSRNISASELTKLVDGLPDHWTVAVQVPNAQGVVEARRFGFNAGSIQTWDATSHVGLEGAAKATRSAMDAYMTSRAAGVRGTRSFFTTDLGSVAVKDVTKKLTQLKSREYNIYEVRKKIAIESFVVSWEKGYVKGSAYYELMKPETIQGHKQVCVQHRKNGKVYSGDGARQLLKLPAYEVRVSPGDHGDWRIFVQSTSVNRWLIPGTQLIVLK